MEVFWPQIFMFRLFLMNFQDHVGVWHTVNILNGSRLQLLERFNSSLEFVALSVLFNTANFVKFIKKVKFIFRF